MMPQRTLSTLACTLTLMACEPTSAVPGPGAVRVNSIDMSLVRVPAGEFVRGSQPGEDGRFDNEGPARTVRISRDFEIGVHEVTNAQFRAFVDASGYVTEAERDVGGGFGIDFATGRVVQESGIDWRSPGFPDFVPGDDHPVLLVSWDDAEAFCRWLSQTEGRTYRLPTEAEWEYAARGGTSTPWWTGARAAELAGAGNSADAALHDAVPAADWCEEWDDRHAFTAPVGSYAPNPFGIHDVHGNVWEWCADWYGSTAYAQAPEVDPQGPRSGSFRTIRGGGWFNPARQQRSAQRIYFHPTFRYCLLSGFRVVCEIE